MPIPKSIPEGRIGRFVRVASAGARSGAGILLGRDSSSAAEQAAQVLSQLRGLAAKVGQTISYVDGAVPEQHRAAYERAMAQLLAAATTSDAATIRRQVERELGAPIDRLFREWEDEPIASASIGQVHRARSPDGTQVAVKVQHPGIDRAIEADLSNAKVVEGLLTALGPRALNARDVFDVIRQRFREELDYELEARHQTAFAELHREDPRIFVPKVFVDLSSKRVLTSEFVEGASLEEAAGATSDLRRVYAETLWRFVFKGNLVAGMFNADPHPGNYLFHPNGITFLDFGCVQPLEGRHQSLARAVHLAALSGDEVAFRRCVVELLGTKGGSYEVLALDYVRECFEPLFRSPFHMTRDYVTRLVRRTQDVKRAMFAKDKSFVQLPPNMVFMNRLQFGFYSVLSRLNVTVDYHRVESELLREAGLLTG